MVVAAKAGISFSDFMQMDGMELACYIRGDQLRDTEMIRWARFFVAAMLSPHSKKPIRPTDLIKLPDDEAIKKVQTKVSAEKLQQMEEVFKKWDAKK